MRVTEVNRECEGGSAGPAPQARARQRPCAGRERQRGEVCAARRCAGARCGQNAGSAQWRGNVRAALQNETPDREPPSSQENSLNIRWSGEKEQVRAAARARQHAARRRSSSRPHVANVPTPLNVLKHNQSENRTSCKSREWEKQAHTLKHESKTKKHVE
jgi:hypothetical protein